MNCLVKNQAIIVVRRELLQANRDANFISALPAQKL
jgi:hypothetical protein